MENSRKKKAAKNMVFALMAKAFNLFMGFFSRSVFLHFLSIEYLGINGLFSNILMLLSFAELGLGNVMLYNMYKPIAENDTKKLQALLNIYRKTYVFIAALVFILGLAMTPFLQYIISETPNIAEDIRIIYIVYIFNTAISYLFSYRQTILLADQKSYAISSRTSFVNVAREVVQIVVLFLTHNYMLYLLVMVISTILLNVWISTYVSKKYSWVREKNNEKLSKAESRKIFFDVRILAISKISGVVCNGTDNIVISKLIGMSQVGLASNYLLIINNLSGLIYGMLQGLTGSIGNLNTNGDKRHQKEIFDQIQLLVYLIYSLICICLICLCDTFISEVWIGEEYLLPFNACLAMVLIVYQSGMNFPAYTFRTTYGLFNYMQWFYSATAVLNIILSIVLAKYMGIAGVYFASVFSKMVTSEIGDGYFTFKYGFEQNPLRYFIKYYAYFSLFLINCLICSYVISFISISGVLGFLAKGILCATVCMVINVIVLVRTNAFRNLLLIAKKMIRR